jgi:MFS family permease
MMTYPFVDRLSLLSIVSLVLLLTYGLQYFFGVFFTTMLPDLGWSRASLASAFSLYSLVYIGLSIASGHLTDRLGPRWVIAFGGCSLGSGAYVPCTATAVKWFRHRRGLAVSIAGGGASLGIAGVPPLSEALIARFGWRQTYVLFGIVLLVLINVLAAFVIRDPETLRLQPDGDDGGAPPAGIAPPPRRAPLYPGASPCPVA